MKRVINYFFGAVSFWLCSCQYVQTKALKESVVKTDTVYSTYLQEDRLLSIYLPKNYVPTKKYPAVYTTDGQLIVKAYKEKLDSLIEQKKIKDLIVVGVHSNERKVEGETFEYRNYEYCRWMNSKDVLLSERFHNHMQFFKKEVFAHVKQKYAVAEKNRVFYGTSNGADFGFSLFANSPDLFEHAICFSFCSSISCYEKYFQENEFPELYFGCGKEEMFLFPQRVNELDRLLTLYHQKHTKVIFKGGHDRKKWRKEFCNGIQQILLLHID